METTELTATLIEINKDVIKDKVELITSTLGAKAIDKEGKVVYTSFALTRDKEVYIDNLITITTDRLCDSLAAFFDDDGGLQQESESYDNIVLNTLEKHSRHTARAITQAATEYIVNYIIKDWLYINGSEAASYYADQANQFIQLVHALPNRLLCRATRRTSRYF